MESSLIAWTVESHFEWWPLIVCQLLLASYATQNVIKLLSLENMSLITFDSKWQEKSFGFWFSSVDAHENGKQFYNVNMLNLITNKYIIKWRPFI